MRPFRFFNWEIYRSAQKLLGNVIKIVKSLPREHRFELGGQIIRAAFSVVLNIAEGSGKRSDRELGRYLDISMGSLYETFAAIETLTVLEILSEDVFFKIKDDIESLGRQMGGFKRSLDKR